MKSLIAVIFLLYAGQNFAQEIPAVKMDDVLRIIDTSTSPVVINFWATWCAPCVHEIPYFEKQVALFKDKGVKLYLVSLDFPEDYPQKIKTFINKQKYRSQVFRLSETNADEFCPRLDKGWEGAIPATLFINRAKNYRHFSGVELTEKMFRAALIALTE